MSTGRNLFTPRDKRTNERMTLMIADHDISLIGRRGPWQAVVTDLDSSVTYRCEGAPCTLPGCFCDAIAEELPKEEADSPKRFARALQAADEAFWAAILPYYPEVTTGDFDPNATTIFEMAQQQALRTWLLANSPEAMEECPTTCQQCCENDADADGEYCLECKASQAEAYAEDNPDPNYFWLAGTPDEDNIRKFETKEACDARMEVWIEEGYPYVGPTRVERSPLEKLLPKVQHDLKNCAERLTHEDMSDTAADVGGNISSILGALTIAGGGDAYGHSPLEKMLPQLIAELSNIADCLVDDEKNEQTICLDMASDLRGIINRMREVVE